MEFFTYNVILPDGKPTNPHLPPHHEASQTQAVLRTLKLLYGDTITQRSIADLGCSEGAYALEFAKLGMKSLGVEARDTSIARCEYLKFQFQLGNLWYAKDDVRNIENYGSFDAIFCCGLLYHLDKPVEFLKKLAGISKTLILQTHYSTHFTNPYGCGKMVEHEGVIGRWKPDPPESTAWAAIGNTESVWIEKRHLVQTLKDAGYDIVYEQYDFLDNVVTNNYIQDHDRSLFVATKLV